MFFPPRGALGTARSLRTSGSWGADVHENYRIPEKSGAAEFYFQIIS